jgi:hypothetical protein
VEEAYEGWPAEATPQHGAGCPTEDSRCITVPQWPSAAPPVGRSWINICHPSTVRRTRSRRQPLPAKARRQPEVPRLRVAGQILPPQHGAQDARPKAAAASESKAAAALSTRSGVAGKSCHPSTVCRTPDPRQPMSAKAQRQPEVPGRESLAKFCHPSASGRHAQPKAAAVSESKPADGPKHPRLRVCWKKNLPQDRGAPHLFDVRNNRSDQSKGTNATADEHRQTKISQPRISTSNAIARFYKHARIPDQCTRAGQRMPHPIRPDTHPTAPIGGSNRRP